MCWADEVVVIPSTDQLAFNREQCNRNQDGPDDKMKNGTQVSRHGIRFCRSCLQHEHRMVAQLIVFYWGSQASGHFA